MSAAFPKPFESLFLRLRESPEEVRQSVSTLHCLSKADRTNPPELGEQVASYFLPASKVLWHDAGHQVPPAASMSEVSAFLDDCAAAVVAANDIESD